MKKFSFLQINNKKILDLKNKFDIITILSIILTLITLTFYYISPSLKTLIISIILFEISLSIKIGAFISAIILENELKLS